MTRKKLNKIFRAIAAAATDHKPKKKRGPGRPKSARTLYAEALADTVFRMAKGINEAGDEMDRKPAPSDEAIYREHYGLAVEAPVGDGAVRDVTEALPEITKQLTRPHSHRKPLNALLVSEHYYTPIKRKPEVKNKKGEVVREAEPAKPAMCDLVQRARAAGVKPGSDDWPLNVAGAKKYLPMSPWGPKKLRAAKGIYVAEFADDPILLAAQNVETNLFTGGVRRVIANEELGIETKKISADSANAFERNLLAKMIVNPGPIINRLIRTNGKPN